jgi:amino acid adenylation domain-containing protein
MAFIQADCELDVLERFELFAERRPRRMALKDNSGEMTYAELDVAAEGVARTIRKQASDAEAPVVVFTEDDRMRCVGLLGAWKTGRAYVPIDPSLPEALVAAMLENLDCGVLLTDAAGVTASRVANRRLEVLRIDEHSDVSGRAERATLMGDALAWIIHTSGSTGRLKGVMQSYRNACHYVRSVIEGLRIRSEDRVATASPLTMHAGVVYALAAFSSGAGLCLIAPLKQTPEALVRRLVEEQITVLFTVPTVFRRLAPLMAEHGGLPALRLLRLSGETVTSRDLQLYRQSLDPRCVLSIGLGTTETGGITHAYIDRTTHIEGPHIPVGYPVEGVEVRLIDERGHDVAAGLAGEIVVIGRYLSPGYLGLPELTNSLFSVTNSGQRMYRTGDVGRQRPDGSIEHFGRKDLQVQVAGHRVEMAAVESVILGAQHVREAAVAAFGDSSGDVRLVAYVVADRDPPPTNGELRRQLRELLPDYMIPSLFIFVYSLPLTPNGKIDRRALPDPGNSRPELDSAYAPPRSPVEEQLNRIWAEVLSLDCVGIHDNFFDLGGHSLAAMRVVSQVIKKFELEIPLKCLFESPTVAQMAAVIGAHQGKKLAEKEKERILTELESLTDEEAQRLLANESETGPQKRLR